MQYVATKSGNPDLMAGLTEDKALKYGTIRQWSDASFGPVSREFEALFATIRVSPKP